MRLLTAKKIAILFFALVAILAVYFLKDYYALLKTPLLKEGDSPVVIEIKPKSSANAFIQQLYEKKLIKSKALLRRFMQYKNYSKNIKAGFYEIKPHETIEDLLEHIIKGQVLTKSFSIIEGTTLLDVITNLKSAPYLSFYLQYLDTIKGKYESAEGLLLADTYKYDAGSSATALLKKAKENLLSYLNESWQNRSPNLPYNSSYELLIAASILEKETALPNERKIIAGIIVNRLKKNMPLQMDPTVIYALDKTYNRQLKHEDLKINSPYNTYIYKGLPPTPIAMVGKISIDAAAHPIETNYLYFYAKGDGSHQFSATYDEQRKAIHLFKPRN